MQPSNGLIEIDELRLPLHVMQKYSPTRHIRQASQSC